MKNSRYLFFLEDRPPLQVLLALGAQHALLAMVFLIYPLAVAQALRLDSASTLTLLTASLVGIGIATCLHCIKRPFGSGSLAVEIPTPVFLPIALFAGSTGGVGALAGVTMLCGAVGLLFGTLLQRFRGLFPPEVCGVAVFMLGISIIRPGMLNSFDITDPTGDIRLAPLAVAITTLVVMTLISVIGKRRAKMLALFGGILTGVILSILLGLLRLEHWRSISEVPMWSWPSLSLIRPSMDLSMVPLAVLMAVIASVDNLGMLVGIQRQGNPSWQKLDVSQASVGLKVSSIGDLLSGMFGGMPTGISSANLGLAHATGAVSRVIALMAGSLLLATAFMPKLVSAIAVLPRPIIGAIVLYTAIYMVVSGISLILNRVLNDRRVFVIGFSIVMGIASASMPTLFDQAPVVLRPILESPLATGVLSAILLNHLLSLGTTLRTSLALDLGPGESELVQEYKVNQSLRHALQEPAGELALAKVFVDRAVDVTSELVAALKIGGYIKGKVELFTRIDEDRIEVSVSYEGLPAPVSGLDDQKSNPGMGADWESTNLAKTFSQVDRVITSSSSHQQRLTLRYEN